MNEHDPTHSTPNVPSGKRPINRQRFQISLSLMLLLMVVFAFMSAALFYASRVPMIREEISVLLYGKTSDGGEDAGRLAHRAFIMFTFTSPLLLAGTLSLIMGVLQKMGRR
ncbi:hypothetical protein [Rhodopirellula sp. MGV]|uniref:hypothetical protein n=1 Tax=Rhodopirellula sp. MGV TaxID=2023130 RepID=UPI000B978B3B|nr:hypothetical protein [Rhodopirellula sp. MGV]OYP31130.1 hypothetical protein CGZ80_21300 [Rhodopirellula sp. MGV]PNY36046.1 hypothetical protein C2E31_15125 [Rhodopirellula baltica]